MLSLESFIHKRFNVGALDRRIFTVLGFELDQNADGTVVLPQCARVNGIDEKDLSNCSDVSPKFPDRSATVKELCAYRSVLEKILYVVSISHPLILSHASYMASKVSSLQHHHLKDLKALLRFDKKNASTLRFI